MKKNYLIILFAWIIFMDTTLADTHYKQPLFSLEFSIYGTGADIRLNDIPVYFHDTQGQTSSQKPIPESIVDGDNVLTIKSFPLKGYDYEYQQGAYIEVIISVREKDVPLNENKSIIQLKLNPANPEDNLLDGTLVQVGGDPATILSHSDKETRVERHAQIKSPFPRWAWQDGQMIEDTPENFDSLLGKYKEIWEALDSGNMKKINQLYDPAAQEFSWAYHYKTNKHGHRLMNTGGFVGSDEWKLGDINKILKKVEFSMYIYANGRLVYLVDEDNEPSLITYLNRKVKMISTQKFSFYKNKVGEWIMIR